MEEWLKFSVLFCIFGFLREFRPSDSYFVEFMVGPVGNVTTYQLQHDIYPIAIYSYLSLLIIVFLLTDLLRYKPLIICSGLFGVIIYSLIIWTSSIRWLEIIEFFFGTYYATEVAYIPYIYAKVDNEFYSKILSHTRVALFIGKFVGSVLAQILINFDLMDYQELNYITLGAQISATLWPLILPNVQYSFYFHRNDSENKLTDNKNSSLQQIIQSSKGIGELSAIHLLWIHFKNAYTNLNVIIWSLWYGLAFCGYLQVTLYVQILWNDIVHKPSVAWNGAVDALFTLLAAIFTLLADYSYSTRLFKFKNGTLIVLAVLSIIEGSVLLFATWTRNLYWSYIGYIIFGGFYSFSITIASAEVTKYLEEETFGLVFGINTLIGLILQSILTMVVISESGFNLNVFDQYTLYSFYFIGIGLFSITLINLVHIIKYLKRRNTIYSIKE